MLILLSKIVLSVENTDKKGGGAIFYDMTSNPVLVSDCIFEGCSPYAIYEEVNPQETKSRQIEYCIFYEEMHGQNVSA